METTAALYGYAFGDETGEAGFRFERGSSPFFVAGLVLTNQPDTLRAYVGDFKQELKLKPMDELSFHRSPDHNRLAFLSGLLEFDIAVRTLAVNKHGLPSELQKLNRAEFYLWAFSRLLLHTLDELSNATVVLDEFGRAENTVRAIRRALSRMLSASTLRQHIRKIHSRRSHSEPLLQVADIVTGSVSRYVSTGDDRFYAVIEPRTTIVQV